MVKLFGGMVRVVGEGKIQWKIEDNNIKFYNIITRKSQCVPAALMFLFVPKQLTQQANNNHPNPEGTCYETKVYHCTLL